ncbi:uncharacterized protein LOC129576195 [Sitodiplosis mosellana]|uniref:uncharacterized protein LOC129576195 n=1 Tax=Sitodiplosis mosellana TaxID=263140 RepID=UPI002444DC7B|nr:uncharacterized protein LOC129576195 [Sitodiplosis mosellana]XP_055316866.1 uncharacterized protein LOC129576195 [Sitodiplosis mosellana]
MDPSNTTDSDSGLSGASASSEPTSKRPKLSTDDDSPISKAYSDLAKKISDFSEEVLKAIQPSEDAPNLEKLNRFLFSADFSIKKLQEIRHSIKLVGKDCAGSAENHSETHENQSTKSKICTQTSSSADAITDLYISVGTFLGVALNEVIGCTYKTHSESQLDNKSPKVKKRTQLSSSAAAIAALNLSIGQFFGAAMSEINLCTNARGEPSNPAKSEKLKRLSNWTDLFLQDVKSKREKIMKKIDPNYEPNTELSDEEMKLILMMRSNPKFAVAVEQYVKDNPNGNPSIHPKGNEEP